MQTRHHANQTPGPLWIFSRSGISPTQSQSELRALRLSSRFQFIQQWKPVRAPGTALGLNLLQAAQFNEAVPDGKHKLKLPSVVIKHRKIK